MRLETIGEVRGALRKWIGLELTWGHSIHQIQGFGLRENWHGEITLTLHSWWTWPRYFNYYYDGPHCGISFGFVVLGWEPWGGGRWLHPVANEVSVAKPQKEPVTPTLPQEGSSHG